MSDSFDHKLHPSTSILLDNDDNQAKRKRSYSDEPSCQEKTYRSYNKTFPQILYEILMKPELNHILSFLPNGGMWKVHDKRQFESEVMKKYFKTNKWESFLRQVTGWGFKRINAMQAKTASERGCYWHELFLQYQPDLVSSIRRISVQPNERGLPFADSVVDQLDQDEQYVDDQSVLSDEKCDNVGRNDDDEMECVRNEMMTSEYDNSVAWNRYWGNAWNNNDEA